MSEKTILITGANSGIGYATTKRLAEMGHRIIMVTRQTSSGQQARDQILRDQPSAQLHHYTCDLASFAQVRQLAEHLHRDFSHIDVHLNNAGLITRERMVTEDGFEYQFQVNHLAHFLLTQLNIDLLRKAGNARIINVSSEAHKAGKLFYTDVNLTNNFKSFRAYAQSKLANVLFTYGTCSRVVKEGMTSNALHPGVIGSRFGTSRNGNPDHPAIRIYQKLALKPEKGSDTPVYLAVSPEVEGKSGGYYKNKKAVSSKKSSYDPDAATALWELSLKMVGLEKSLI